LREDYRHFRVERIVESSVLSETSSTSGGKLMEGWFARQAATLAPP